MTGQAAIASPRLSRRTAMAVIAASSTTGCAKAADGAQRALTLYSPAPAGNPLHALNLRVAAALDGGVGMSAIDTVPVPLPDSVNRISGLPPLERAWHLPIVTTVDFMPARAGGGPAHHRYERPSPDLLLAAPLYDVGLGIQVLGAKINSPGDLRGKRIGVPPRPSAVRLLTEALLHDGWGILSEVELVPMSGPDAAKAMMAGRLDATSWNLVVPGPTAHAPILSVPGGRYLPVGQDALDRIHAANGFRTALTRLSGALPPLLSFAQGVAAWRETPDRVVQAFARRRATFRWPMISPDAVHPAARAWTG